MHRYRQPGTEEGAPAREQTSQSLGVAIGNQVEPQGPTDVYEKYDAMLHAGVTVGSGRGSSKKPEILSIGFMKKYIQYAKTRVKPVLTQEASDRIAEIYVGLRNDEMEGNQRRTSPLTVRTLETVIRLATAHAKSRLSSRVEEQDALAAEGILRFALFKEVVEDESRKKRRRTQTVDFASSSEESDNDEEGGDEVDQLHRGAGRGTRSTRAGTRLQTAASSGRQANGVQSLGAETRGEDDEDEEDVDTTTPRRSTRSRKSANTPSQSQASFASSIPSSQLPSQSQGDSGDENDLASGAANLALDDEPITAERLATFKTTLGQLLSTELFEDDSAHVDDVVTAVNEKVGRREGGSFTKSEATKALKKLEEANRIM
jgi:DNA replication licensing factor MCM3